MDLTYLDPAHFILLGIIRVLRDAYKYASSKFSARL